jgi:hypothetical protein
VLPRATLLILLTLTTAPAQTPLHRVAGSRLSAVTHGFDEATARVVLELAESAFEIAERRYSVGASAIPAAERARRPELHLYREASGYRTATLYRDAEQFQQNLACALLDGTAHVALQPPVSPEFLAEIGLPLATARLIAHESAHLARMAAAVDPQRHPRWFADAFAQVVAHEVLVRRGLAREFEAEPEFSTQFVRAQGMRREGRLASVTEILARRTERDASFGLSHDLYATHLAFGSWLRDGEPAPFVALARSFVSGRGVTELSRDTASFAAFVASRRPQWDEVRRSLGWRRVEAEWTLEQVAFEGVDAAAWSLRPLDAKSFACELSCRFLPSRTARADVLLADVEGRVYRVSFDAEGVVTLARHDPRTDRWHVIASDARGPIERTAESAISLSASDGVLTVSTGSEVELRHELGAIARIGLGCAAGSAVRWLRGPFAAD